VVLTADEALLGISPTRLNVSRWTGGAPPYPPDPDRINRAELKLLEALETFRIRLRPGASALDLGAGTGGWTRILTQHGQRVTAVDPRPIVPSLLCRPDVRYERMTAEEYLSKKPGEFDLVTNDMIMAPQDSSRLMLEFDRHLAPGGMAIMTLKLGAREQRRVMDHCFRLLRQAYRVPRVRNLYYNRSEVTVWLKKKGTR